MKKKEDLFIVTDVGTLNASGVEGGFSIARVRVSNGKTVVDKVDNKTIHAGFGVGGQQALEDFIRRNVSEVIERIFDAT